MQENYFALNLSSMLFSRFALAIVPFVFQLFFQSKAFAQEYLDMESNNIRVDPEWITTYEAAEFAWAYDVKADQYGNVYSTGYFRRNLKFGDKYIEPETRCGSWCPDTYFLMKHNNAGKLLWVRYADGNSRPCKIVMDRQGFVYTVGSVLDRNLDFSSSDSGMTRLDQSEPAGIFIAKYDSSGKLITTRFYSEGKQEMAHDAFLDEKNNLYIGGIYHYRSAQKPDESKNSFLLAKFNEDLSLQWKQEGDTLGRSSINSIFIDKQGKVFATGGFYESVRLGENVLSVKNYNANAFVARFDNKGKVDWVVDSVGKSRLGAGQGLVCDSKGNIYVFVNTSYSLMFFTKLNRKGEIQWVQSIKGKLSNGNSKLLIDEKDGIYICGEGYGAVFGSSGSDLYSYKSKGGTDFYFARYDTKGKLLWLKAGGGKGTDYCKSIALYNNNLFAFGWFGGEMRFFDTIIREKSGYTFLLSKFDIRKLEYVDKGKHRPAADEVVEKLTVNKITCECEELLEEEKRHRYVPSLDNLVHDSMVRKMTGFRYVSDANAHNNIFFDRLQTDNDRDRSGYYFNAISYKPIRIIHPDNTFTINLTPCKGNNRHEFPVSVNYSHSIMKYIPDFKYESFDHSTKGYFDVLMSIYNGTEEEILNRLLFDYEMTDVDPFIKKINTKYGMQIRLNKESAEASIDSILLALNKKKIVFNDFILNEFILTKPKPHTINDQEKDRMQHIFSKWVGKFTFEGIDEIIYPQVRVHLDIKNIGIEISEKVIRKWDAIKNEPAKGKSGKDIQATILAGIPSFNYETATGMNAPLQGVCFTRSELAGTGILLSFSRAYLLDSKTSGNALTYTEFPLFVTDSTFHKEGPMQTAHYTYGYDSALTKFSGLLITDATLNIPFKDKNITASAPFIILNNHFVSGTIVLPREGMKLLKRDTSQASVINIKTTDFTLETTYEELGRYFRSIGITDFRIIKENGQVLVFFRKFAGK